MLLNEKLKKLIQRLLQNATVKIYVDDEFKGSGFFISPDGYILTAYHCIGEYPPDIVIQTKFNEKFYAQLDEAKS
jgi:S1-C subfamily serine protease